jgi:hypothetical protein
VIQIICTSLLTFNLLFVKKIAEHFTDNLFVMLAAVALTAFYAPLISYGLLGMEVSLLALILTAVVWLVLKNGSNFRISIYILLAISTLVRFDMAVPYLIIFAVLFVTQKENRKQHLIWGLGLLVLSLGGQTLARYLYYGTLLPNTYYLKVEGWPYKLRILRGLYALVQFAYYSNWTLFLLPFTLFLFRRDWKVTLLALALIGQVAYSVYVGGDAWENHGGANRYIVIAMPVFFITFSWSAGELLKRAANQLSTAGIKRRIFEIGWHAIFIVLFVFSILNFNTLLGDWKSIERWDFARRPDYVAGNEHNVQQALAIENVTLPGASVAVVGAGTIPYLLPDRYAIDILGKADPYIAHQNVRTPMSIADIPFMRPGHMKWDYAYTFGKLKPDVIVSIWEGTSAEAAPYLKKDYVNAVIGEKLKVFLLKNSPNIRWENVIIK